jgi:hypothetical protein
MSKYPVYEWTLSLTPNSEVTATFRSVDFFLISKGQLLRADTTKYVIPYPFTWGWKQIQFPNIYSLADKGRIQKPCHTKYDILSS